jgi:hypothetical protein
MGVTDSPISRPAAERARRRGSLRIPRSIDDISGILSPLLLLLVHYSGCSVLRASAPPRSVGTIRSISSHRWTNSPHNCSRLIHEPNTYLCRRGIAQ